MSTAGSLLVVAGEASGDDLGAAVVRDLGVGGFGWGGSQLRAEGVETLRDVSSLGVMGVGSVLARAPSLVKAVRALLRTVRARRPRAALLVGFSELNAWLGPRLRRQGVRVLWYAPPQVWAWRPGRARRLAAACDRMAVLLPFERELWQRVGAEVTWVGHPATDPPLVTREQARCELGLPSNRPLLALLPGSRRQEVQRHTEPMLAAAVRLRRRRPDLEARVIVAPGLDEATRRRLLAAARSAAIDASSAPVRRIVPAFDAALVASGTATLECAVFGAPPVIVYRTDVLSAAVARRLLRVRFVGLPNLILNRAVFPELLQSEVRPQRLARAAAELIDHHPRYVEYCKQVRTELEIPGPGTASLRAAEILRPWLS